MIIQPIVLAAGNGRRIIQEAMAAGLGELPKVMYPLFGRPLIDYPLKQLEEVRRRLATEQPSERAKTQLNERSDATKNTSDGNIKLIKPIVVVKFQQQRVRDHLQDQVIYVEQNPKPLGTGHAVLVCESAVTNVVDGVLVLNGDMPAWHAATILQLIKEFAHARPTLALTTVNFTDSIYNADWFAYGRIIRDERANLQKIVEQKDATAAERQVSECNPSLYCFERDWLFSTLKQVKNNNSQREYYLTDLLAMAMQRQRSVVSVPVTDWREALGVNTLEQLKLTAKLLQR